MLIVKKQNPSSHIINLEDYSRNGFYQYFKGFEVPVNSRTIQIDITNLRRFIKEKNLRFFHPLLYLLTKASNQITEFRFRIIQDNLFEFDYVFPVFTHLHKDNNPYFINGVFTGIFRHDYQINSEKSDSFSPECLEKDRLDNQGHIICSNVPWYSFTSMTLPYSSQHASIPTFSIGKFYEERNKIIMPMAIQTNHALVDGYHVGQFLQAFEEYSNNPAEHLML
jgi:chloramphenicol O-acetyltransferase type A